MEKLLVGTSISGRFSVAAMCADLPETLAFFMFGIKHSQVLTGVNTYAPSDDIKSKSACQPALESSKQAGGSLITSTSGEEIIPSPTPGEIGPSPKLGTDEKYQKLGEALEKWYDKNAERAGDFNLEDLSLSMGVKKSSLLNYFNHFLEKDFRTWKVKVRMEKVKEALIEDEEASVAEVARRYGFKDMSNFHRQFKKAYGMAPLKWREENG